MECQQAQPVAPRESLTRNLLDRMILPGAIGFTRLGYDRRKKSWSQSKPSMSGRTVIVTGATAGLGRVTAEELAGLDAHVILVGRNVQKLETTRREITRAIGNNLVDIEVADLGVMLEVKAVAQRILDRDIPVHVLINNAAALPLERTETAEGFETAFATDLLSPWLLTRLLIPRLKESAPARIVNVSSGGMYLSGVNLEDLQSRNGSYDGSKAYAQAKRGLMMLTESWSQELAESGVVANAMHPGWADTPGVRTSLPGFHKVMRRLLRTPEQGADTIIWLASAPEAGLVSGKFWLDREPHLNAIIPGTAGTPDQRRKLTETLEQMTQDVI